jgi:hypothetical protein
MNRNLVIRGLLFALVLMSVMMTWSTASMAQMAVGISVRIGPPALPVYEQPLCPGPGYLWTPGYWAWSDDDGYYWVPGTWVLAPAEGLLWTPGYWGWGDGVYLWHAGYWGPHVGFYGGIDYGYGYGGEGFYGGEWRGGAFYYNTAVMRVDTVHVTNVYVNRTVIVHNESHVAFNGGAGGVAARPTARDEEYAREPHREVIAAQVEHQHAASQNRALFARENHGRPAVAATAKAGEFSGRGVVAARAAGAAYHEPKMSPKEARSPARPEGNAARANPERSNTERGNTGEANKGSHSVTPPAKGTAIKSNRGEGAANHTATNNRGAENKPNAARTATPPPSSSHAANGSRPVNEGKPASEARPRAESRPVNAPHPQNESRPASTPHAAQEHAAPARSAPAHSAPAHSEPSHAAPPPRAEAPRESAPKAAPHPASPPAQHQSAPHEEKHPGKGR